VKFVLNKWTAANTYGLSSQATSFLGTGLQLDFSYSLTQASDNKTMNIVSGVKSGASWALTVSPADLKVGQMATLTWGMVNTGTCSAVNGWSTETTFNGTKLYSVTSAAVGVKKFSFICAGTGISSAVDTNFTL
jgi:hypothetical protein